MLSQVVELELSGDAVKVPLSRGAARLQSRLLEQAAALHDVIDAALERGDRIAPRDASLMLSRAIKAAKDLQPMCEDASCSVATIDELVQRHAKLTAAVQELAARSRAIDVTHG